MRRTVLALGLLIAALAPAMVDASPVAAFDSGPPTISQSFNMELSNTISWTIDRAPAIEDLVTYLDFTAPALLEVGADLPPSTQKAPELLKLQVTATTNTNDLRAPDYHLRT